MTTVAEFEAALSEADRESLMTQAQPVIVEPAATFDIAPLLLLTSRGSQTRSLPDLQDFQRVKFWITCKGTGDFQLEVFDSHGESRGAIWGPCGSGDFVKAGVTPIFDASHSPVTFKVVAAPDATYEVGLVALRASGT
ncbi:hypothetical protein JT358_00040 [Micrococcales bacterium 31B]|nr:hypothetical protein [Micrococcales bacterium 31B]